MAQGSRLRAWSASGLAAALLLVAPVVLAQATFDAASIKESTSLETGGSMRMMPDGGVRAGNMAARALITIAYGLEGYQLVNAPAWASDTRYNIEAKPAAQVPRAQTYTMLQALLAERFRFAYHRETREVDGFVLVRASRDRLGPQLRVSEADCEAKFLETPRCREGRIRTDQVTLVGSPMTTVVQVLVSKVAGPVSDETGLTGRYDIEMQWTNDVASTDDRPSIYTALQEQLGLRLERRRTKTEVFVVDRFERATPD